MYSSAISSLIGMPSHGEWAAIGLIVAAFAGVGIALYLTRKPAATPQGLRLRRVVIQPQPQDQEEPRVILQNEERMELERDHAGRLKTIVVHRMVTE